MLMRDMGWRAGHEVPVVGTAASLVWPATTVAKRPGKVASSVVKGEGVYGPDCRRYAKGAERLDYPSTMVHTKAPTLWRPLGVVR